MTSAAAWTEPVAIDALAVDCAVAAPPVEDFTPQPLACELPWEQSCSYDPCFFKQQECQRDCGNTCGSCEASCTNTCSSCKASCASGAAGDACRRACASTTGSCRQSCIARRDKCATAGCTAAAQLCAKNEPVKWKKNGCWGICPKVNACWDLLRRPFEKRRIETP
ncbi:hypothetical protein LZC95_01570 [Pendulispora brunnea]|uniref:Uncharacterized protein n=1 Tax=Pendulispora brunnea TaxID=2905690 RepID=A0ABZ2KD86_9BACT